jgi:hypothetical protein
MSAEGKCAVMDGGHTTAALWSFCCLHKQPGPSDAGTSQLFVEQQGLSRSRHTSSSASLHAHLGGGSALCQGFCCASRAAHQQPRSKQASSCDAQLLQQACRAVLQPPQRAVAAVLLITAGSVQQLHKTPTWCATSCERCTCARACTRPLRHGALQHNPAKASVMEGI